MVFSSPWKDKTDYEKQLLNRFSNRPYHLVYNNYLKNGMKVGIITNNYNKAEEIFDKLVVSLDGIVSYKKGFKDMIIETKHGDYYQWIKANDNSRGHRLTHAYIDTKIDINVINNIICPICVYCTQQTVKFI